MQLIACYPFLQPIYLPNLGGGGRGFLFLVSENSMALFLNTINQTGTRKYARLAQKM